MGRRVSGVVVETYDIELELDTPEAASFRCRTVVRFSCEQPSAVADLAASSVVSVVLNGRPLVVSKVWDGRSRLELAGVEGVNVLEVTALFPFATTGRGLRRATDPDGTTYLYNINFPAASSRVFCCFDDPDLRAQVTLTLSTPSGWTHLVSDTTTAIAPYLVTSAAGRWSELHRTVLWCGNDSVPVAVFAHRTRAHQGDRGRQVSDLMAQSIVFFEHRLGVPYPYGKCEAVFVRDLPTLAFSAPGLILLSDKVFDLIEARGARYATTVVSHEVAHAWIGCLVDSGDAPWLVEAGATYLARTAVRELIPGSDPWAAMEPLLPDAAYVADAVLINDLENTIGRDNVLRGLGTFLRRFAHHNAGPAELAACWSETSGHDLTGWGENRSRGILPRQGDASPGDCSCR